MRVTIGNVNGGQVNACFMESLLRTYADPPDGMPISFLHASGLHIDRMRDALARKFLATAGDADVLVFIDSDMEWEPDDVAWLATYVKNCRADQRPVVVGALVMNLNNATGAIEPVAWPAGFESGRLEGWKDGGKQQVQIVGTSFTAYPASILEAVLDEHESMFENVRDESAPGGFIGHDVEFCYRAGRLGYEVFVACDIRPGHEKTLMLRAQ